MLEEKPSPNTSNSDKHVIKWDPQRKQARAEHRMLMEKKLGRKLRSNEIVHHKDHNKQNNKYSNFELTTRAKHNTHHKLQHKFCTMAECRAKHHAKGLCNTHHKQQLRGKLKKITSNTKKLVKRK